VSLKFEGEILEEVRKLKDRVAELEKEVLKLKQPKDDMTEWLNKKHRQKHG
jgi:hypothetical protein